MNKPPNPPKYTITSPQAEFMKLLDPALYRRPKPKPKPEKTLTQRIVGLNAASRAMLNRSLAAHGWQLVATKKLAKGKPAKPAVPTPAKLAAKKPAKPAKPATKPEKTVKPAAKAKKK